MSRDSHSDPFLGVFRDTQAISRYAKFRPRNDDACAKALKQIVLRVSNEVPSQGLRALVLGPGDGAADVHPLRAANSNIAVDCIGGVTKSLSASSIKVISPTWEDWLETHAWEETSRETYNVVVACQVFQHAAPWRLLMQAIWFVLKPGGLLVVEHLRSDFFNALQGFDQTPDASDFESSPLRDLIRWHRTREYKRGVAWVPHFPSASSDLLGAALTRRGFALDSQYPEHGWTTSTSVIYPDDWAAAFEKHEFGPFKWGESLKKSELDHAAIAPLDQNLEISVEQQYIAYRKEGASPPPSSSVIGFGAFSRLERYTRFDLHDEHSRTETPTFERRYLRSFAQALIQASLLPVSTRIAFLYFGGLTDNKKFRPFDIQAAIVDDRVGKLKKLSTQLARHLDHFPRKWESLTSFLLNTVRQDIALVFRALPNVKKSRVSLIRYGGGRGYLIEIPSTRAPATNDPDIGAHLPLTPLLAFPPYTYSEYSLDYGETGQAPRGDAALCDALVAHKLPKELSGYVHAFRYLLSDHDIHVLPLSQLLADREEPETNRTYTGLGSIVLCTERAVNQHVYPEAFVESPKCCRSKLYREQVHAISVLAKHFSQIAILDQFRVTSGERKALQDAGEKIAGQYGTLLNLYDAGFAIAQKADVLLVETAALQRASSSAVKAFPRGSLHEVPAVLKALTEGRWAAEYKQEMNDVLVDLKRVSMTSRDGDKSADLVKWVWEQKKSTAGNWTIEDRTFLFALKALQHGSMLLNALDAGIDVTWEWKCLTNDATLKARFQGMLVAVYGWPRKSISRVGESFTMTLELPDATRTKENAGRWLDGAKHDQGGTNARFLATVLRGLGFSRSSELESARFSKKLHVESDAIRIELSTRNLNEAT